MHSAKQLIGESLINREAQALRLRGLRTLHIEGDFNDAERVALLLQGAPYHQFEITHAQSLAEAVSLLAVQVFELIIVDMHLPDGHGLEVLDTLHEHVTKQAIIVLSSVEDSDLALDSALHGADDYLIKSRTGSARLLRSIQFAMDRRESSHRFSHSNHGLLGYKQFCTLLEAKIDLEAQLHRSHAALLHFQLDNLASLVNAYGPQFGRRLERVFCQRVDQLMSQRALIYRGNAEDHFVVLYNPVQQNESLQQFCARLTEKLQFPFKIYGKKLYLILSVGIAELDKHDINSPQTWMDEALVAAQMARKQQQMLYIASPVELLDA